MYTLKKKEMISYPKNISAGKDKKVQVAE